MHHIPGKDRNEPLSGSLEELVAPQSFVRIIDAFVDVIDLESFEFSYFQLNEEGRPPFHPSIMMKLLLYGYRYDIRPSRKLAHACKTNIEVMWLIEQRQPSYKTINNFRKDNHKAFREVFRRFVYILKEWKLIGGKTIAIDSFKIRAQNSLKNNYKTAKINLHLKYIDRKIREYEAALDGEDEESVQQKILDKKEKRKAYKKLKRALEKSGESQISTTDGDARAVVFQRNSVKIGYNIQAASDAKHKLLIAMDTGDVNDTKALFAMAKQAAENISASSIKVLADKGYHSERALKACEALGITTYISPKSSSSSKSNTNFSMDKFGYTPRTDTYTCPAGQILRTNGRWYNKKLLHARKSYLVKHYKTKACSGCDLRQTCTKNKMGRVIERSEYQEYITRNNRRVEKAPDYYRQRQQLIEHQFGTLKRQRGFDYTLLCGKEQVLAEVALCFICYNLGRTVSILDFPEMLRRLKVLFYQNFSIFLLRRTVKAKNSNFNTSPVSFYPTA